MGRNKKNKTQLLPGSELWVKVSLFNDRYSSMTASVIRSRNKSWWDITWRKEHLWLKTYGKKPWSKQAFGGLLDSESWLGRIKAWGHVYLTEDGVRESEETVNKYSIQFHIFTTFSANYMSVLECTYSFSLVLDLEKEIIHLIF